MEKRIRKSVDHGNKGCRSYLLAIQDSIDLLKGKWKVQIIVVLTFGKRRFKELQREVVGITGKMLSKELKDLEVNDLVTRTVYPTKPVTIEYELSPYGKSLQKVIRELMMWGTGHRQRIFNKN